MPYRDSIVDLPGVPVVCPRRVVPFDLVADDPPTTGVTVGVLFPLCTFEIDI